MVVEITALGHGAQKRIKLRGGILERLEESGHVLSGRLFGCRSHLAGGQEQQAGKGAQQAVRRGHW